MTKQERIAKIKKDIKKYMNDSESLKLMIAKNEDKILENNMKISEYHKKINEMHSENKELETKKHNINSLLGVHSNRLKDLKENLVFEIVDDNGEVDELYEIC